MDLKVEVIPYKDLVLERVGNGDKIVSFVERKLNLTFIYLKNVKILERWPSRANGVVGWITKKSTIWGKFYSSVLILREDNAFKEWMKF